ncbi:MAG: hypothetical protein ACR2FS_07765 [Phormidesmis sp.]
MGALGRFLVSAVARPVRLLIGGVDFSECFVSYSGARSTADTSGLLSISGQIELQYIPGKTPESLDDRLNPERWHRGQTITIEIGNEAGGWSRFPHGALRIIEAEFDGRGKLALKVGDLIAYGSFKEATDYRDAGIDPPAFSIAGAIANRLLAKMGMPPLVGSLGGLRINYPINVGDNYWQTVGQLAFSTGRYVYVDRFEVIRSVAMRSQPGTADLALTIGRDEIEYGRLTGAQKPPEKVVVTGTRKIVAAYTPYDVSVSEEFGPGYLLGGTSSAPIVLSRTTVIDDWQPQEDRRRITTTKLEARKLVNPDETSSPSGLITSLKEVSDQIYEEEGNGDEDKAKLLRVKSDRKAPKIIAIAPYRNGWRPDPYGLVDFQVEQTTYRFTEDEQTTEQQRRVLSETAANIVPGENWDNSSNSAYGLHVGEDVVTAWAETIPELEWEEVTTTRKAAAKAADEGTTELPANITLAAQLALITTGRDRRTSNNGVRPPAPDRRPPKYTVTEKPFLHEVRLPQRGGGYRERSITLSVPFLAGEVGSSVALKRRRRVYSFGTLAWPKYLGFLFGAMLVGRHRGSEISLPYRDALEEIRPLSVVDVTEPLFEGGTITRSFLVDGDAYALTPGENRCGFDLIWLGDRTGVTSQVTTVGPDGEVATETVELVNPPYQQPAAVESFGASFGNWGISPYGLSGPANDFKSYGASRSRWLLPGPANDFKSYGASRSKWEIGEEDMAVNGQILCTVGAPKPGSGKALEVYGPAGSNVVNLILEIGHGVQPSIFVWTNSIEVARWPIIPDPTNFSRRQFVGTLPETGGMIPVQLGDVDALGDIYRYITIQAMSVSKGTYDHMFFAYNGTNTLTLLGFGD